MKLNFSLDYILSSTKDFLFDNPIISSFEDVREKPGKEHYLFLASLGLQLQNKKIIELGTHKGVSSIALNYGNKKNNNNNTIITYDICNLLVPSIFDNTNIIFKMENLFDPSIRDQNMENILSSDIIFIDIDPHEGIHEFEMYSWLKDNNYKGIILFDDIHLGIGHMGVYTGNSMQQFWSKVDPKYKLDLTSVGHWSGTGLVCFNFSDNELLQYMIPKKIIQTWENKNFEPDFQTVINSWKINNPGYDYYLFDKNEREQFIQSNFNQMVYETYTSIRPGANKADFFRYCYLYINGGIATDIDNLCIGSLDDFLLPNIDFVTCIDFNMNPIEGQHNLALGTLIACRPKHPILLSCIHRIVYNFRNNIFLQGRLDFTGPGVLGRSTNVYMGNPENASFIGKEGIHGSIFLLKFEEGTEYFKDIHNNRVLGQNKNGNMEIVNLYNNECRKLNDYVSWTDCPIDNLYIKIQRKHIALMVYGEFNSYRNNLRKNIQMLEPIIKTHEIHLFILSDKKRNYSPENEKEIRDIFNEFYFHIHVFDYIENYDTIEENQTSDGYYNNIRHEKGSNPFVPNLIYRKYLLNKLKNEYIIQNNIVIDMTIYCRLFDIIINNNLSFEQIEQEIGIIYSNPNIVFGSSDTFFIGGSNAIDYLFNIAILFKEGKPYHDDIWKDAKCEEFISNMDYCLCQNRHIYSPELQYIIHMYYSNYTYKNMRVDFTNPTSELNKLFLYNLILDPNRKIILDS